MLLALLGVVGVGAWIGRRSPTIDARSADRDEDDAHAPLALTAPPLAGSGRRRAELAAQVSVDEEAPIEAPADAPSAASSAVLAPGPTQFRVHHGDDAIVGAELRARRTDDPPVIGAAGLRYTTGGRGLMRFEPAPHAEAARLETQAAAQEATLATTDAAGGAVARLRSGVYQFSAWRDDGSDVWIGRADAVIQDGDAATVDLEVMRAVRIAGRVRDERGVAVADVAVQAWAASDTRVARASARVRTDATGRFTLLGFEREPHVVRAYGTLRGFFGECPSPTLPEPTPEWRGSTATVGVEDLTRVELLVRSIEPLRLALTGRSITDYGVRTFPPTPATPGVWIASGGWGARTSPAMAPAFVRVDQGTGCPWFALNFKGSGPVVGARSPGGLRQIALEASRRVEGTVTPTARWRQVRAFVRTETGERVEFADCSVADGRRFAIDDAPSSSFELAAFEETTRIGPWVEVRAGGDLADVVVPIDSDATSKESDRESDR